MRRLTSLIAVLLLLIAVVPASTCVTARVTSPEESACCRAMHRTCGTMMKQKCCRMAVHSDTIPQITGMIAVPDVQLVCVGQLASLAASIQTVAPARSYLPAEHSPPGLLTAKITVLRI